MVLDLYYDSDTDGASEFEELVFVQANVYSPVV